MYIVEPIGYVRAARQAVEDDFWGGAHAAIVLTEEVELEALDGLDEFSHAEILFLFDRVEPKQVVRGARHPRNNPLWPKVGILAQRAKNRPNRIGSTIVRILKREGRILHVADLDAIDGTPVLDIKPVMKEFLPRGPIHQPAWTAELMQRYWSPSDEAEELQHSSEPDMAQ